MADTLRIKRRAVGGAAGPPATLKAAEIAFNEQDNTLYYGKGDSGGNATSIIAIAGDAKQNTGSYQPLDAGLTSLANAAYVGTLYYLYADNVWQSVNIGSGLTFSGGVLSAAAPVTTPPKTTSYIGVGSYTYTVPAGAKLLVVEIQGGGGGGWAGQPGGGGGVGGSSSFGNMVCAAGSGSSGGNVTTGAGGVLRHYSPGADGGSFGSPANGTSLWASGSPGAVSPWGGAGSAGYGAVGGNAKTGTGSGGGGGGTNSVTQATGGAGGGAGAYALAVFGEPGDPLAAAYSVVVGHGGGGGAASGNGLGGGSGASGFVYVTAYF
jgi:hypothetical protein